MWLLRLIRPENFPAFKKCRRARLICSTCATSIAGSSAQKRSREIRNLTAHVLMCSYRRGGCNHGGTIAEAEKQRRTQVGRVDNTSVCGEKVVPAERIVQQTGDRNHQRTSQKVEGGVKTKISERALLQRIRRALKPDGANIVKARIIDPKLGLYYIVNGRAVTKRDVDPVAVAKKLDVLREWEKAEV